MHLIVSVKDKCNGQPTSLLNLKQEKNKVCGGESLTYKNLCYQILPSKGFC